MTDDQFRTIAMLLTEIRDALYVLVGSTVTETVESDECQHPEETRVSLKTWDAPNHWICTVCRYEHGAISTS